MQKTRRVNLEFPGVLPRWQWQWQWPAVGAEQRGACGRVNLRIRSDPNLHTVGPRLARRLYKAASHALLLLLLLIIIIIISGITPYLQPPPPFPPPCSVGLWGFLLLAPSAFGVSSSLLRRPLGFPWREKTAKEDGGRGHGELHRHHPCHHPAAARRLLQVRLRDRVLDLLAAHLLRLPPWHHLRRLGHHQVEGPLAPPSLPSHVQVMAILLGALSGAAV